MVFMAKPAWVSHDGQPIFSVDVHPDGTRFATAGQDGSVKLWSLAPVLDEKSEDDEKVPRQLATLEGHQGAVNCARWSPDGKHLASGSDDALVMVWRLAGAGERLGAVPFGSKAAKQHEKWRCVLTLRGHTGDIVGVAWAPDSQRLASVSLDNSVRVWDVAAEASRQLVAVLQGHRGMAKGVGWDPIGRYLASQGDDRAVVVWEQRDWSEAARVEAPFQRSTGKTLFRRLTWSPDGQFLCCPHAFKKPANIGVVLRRPTGTAGNDEWAEECDFVGHNAPVGVCAFNQAIFRRDDKPDPYCCCAVGGQDCLISVWLTSRPKPLVVVKDIFEQDVLDLAWTPDGYCLLACSMDGTLATARFERKELGGAIPPQEQQALLRNMYGDLSSTAQMALLESPAQASLEAKSAAADAAAAAAAAASASKTASAAPSPSGAAAAPAETGTPELAPREVIVLQNERRTKDGRRKITPVALDSAPAEPLAPANGAQPRAQPPTATPPRPSTAAAAPAAVAPTLPAAAPSQAAAFAAPNTGAVRPPMAALPGAVPATKRPRVGQPASRPAADSAHAASAVRPLNGHNYHHANGAGANGASAGLGGAASVGMGAGGGTALPGQPRAALRGPGGGLLLAPAAVRASLAVELREAEASAAGAFGGDGGGLGGASSEFGEVQGVLVLECSLYDGGSRGAAGVGGAVGGGGAGSGAGGGGGKRVATGATLTCSRQGDVLWSTALASPAVLLAGNSRFAAAACADGALHVFTAAGRRALPAVHACAAPAALHADAAHSLLVVGADGSVVVWRGLPHRAECSLRCSAGPLFFSGDAPLLQASLLPDGSPVLHLPSGAYVYTPRLQSWLNLADAQFAGSTFASSLPVSARGTQGRPLAKLQQQQTAAKGGGAGGGSGGGGGAADAAAAARAAAQLGALPAERQRQLTLGHLEHQLAAAREMGAADEYREWLRLYALALAQQHAVLRVRELCDHLLGPLDAPDMAVAATAGTEGGEGDGGAWDPAVVGLSKRELLKETVLPALATNRALQRLLSEYLETLQSL